MTTHDGTRRKKLAIQFPVWPGVWVQLLVIRLWLDGMDGDGRPVKGVRNYAISIGAIGPAQWNGDPACFQFISSLYLLWDSSFSVMAMTPPVAAAAAPVWGRVSLSGYGVAVWLWRRIWNVEFLL